MPFDSSRFAKTAGPPHLIFEWGVTAIVAVYFVLGWLTFSLVVLSLIVKSLESESGRQLVEIANNVMPYVFPLGLLILGILISGAVVSSFIFKERFFFLFSRRTAGALWTLSAGGLFLSVLLLAISTLPVIRGEAGMIWYAGFVFGAWLLAVNILFLVLPFLRIRVLDFLGSCARILEDSPALMPSVLFSVAVGVVSAASAIGNVFTLAGLVFLPALWVFPNLDLVFGGFLDAHPFLSYLALRSWPEFIFVMILLPISYFWFFFSNTFVFAFIRALLSAAAYESYRGGEASALNPLWVAAGRVRALAFYAISFWRPLSYAETRFPIPSIVIQKTSASEAYQNSRMITERNIPLAFEKVFFRGGVLFFAVWMASLAVGTSFFSVLVIPRISVFFLIMTGVLLFCALPWLFLLFASRMFYQTFLFAWYLDKEFPSERPSLLPSSVEAYVHEVHKAGLASPAVEGEAGAEDALVRPEQ